MTAAQRANRSPAKVAGQAERDAEIIRLRRTGMAADEIARRFGLSRTRVGQIWRSWVDRIPAEEVGRLRVEQGARLDALAAELWEVFRTQKTLAPDVAVSAARGILAVEERRAKLFGLDAPARAEISIEQVRYEVVAIDPRQLA